MVHLLESSQGQVYGSDCVSNQVTKQLLEAADMLLVDTIICKWARQTWIRWCCNDDFGATTSTSKDRQH